jgi:hypothetical protein
MKIDEKIGALDFEHMRMMGSVKKGFVVWLTTLGPG